MSLRTLVLSSVLLLPACGKGSADSAKADAKATKAAPAKAPGSMPKNRLPPGDPHAAPPPGEKESPTKPPLMESAPGSFDLTVDGTLTHYQRIPTGQNRAVALDGAGVSRVTIAAAESDEGWPHIRLVLDGFRPDQAKYPLTVSSTAEDGPKVTLRYQVGERRIYQLDHDKGADVEITLEAFEGPTLRGSFEGSLAPTAAGLGDPVTVQGKFSIELGLRNVEPGPMPAGAPKTPTDAPGADAEATPDTPPATADAKAPAEPAKAEPAKKH